MPVKESDILGRRIEKLFVSSTLDITPLAQPIYTVGNNPFIAPSKLEYLAFASLNYLPGSTVVGGCQVRIGTTSGGSEWCSGLTVATSPDNPLMVYPDRDALTRPAPFPAGTVIWLNFFQGWNAGSTGIVTLYGFPW